MRLICPRFALSLALVALLVPDLPARAQERCPRCTVADTTDALPGFGVSAIPQLGRAVSASFVASGSYALNVSPLGGDSLHHRAEGTLAAAIHALPWLAIGLHAGGRYDVVTSADRSDDGLAGYPALSLRLAAEPSTGLTLGLDARATVFGGEAPSLDLAATCLLLRALGAYAIDVGGGRFTFALNLGYVLDNSRAAAPRELTDNLTNEDRLSLGASDSGAFVASLGGAYVTDSFDVYGEISSRTYTESSVIGSSPVRIGVGARIWLVPEEFYLGLGGDVRVTPQSASLAAPFVTNAPIEPAVAVRLSAGVRIGAQTPPPVDSLVAATEPAPSEAPPDEVVPTLGTELGRVMEDGQPVANARVELTSEVDGQTRVASTDGDGLWQVAELPLGGAHFRIVAEGLDVVEGMLEIAPGAAVETASAMTRTVPRGEIRGVVQASNGRALAARIEIRPLDRVLVADAEGGFATEVAPGEYDVVVSAPGHRTQTRHVVVEAQGVIVLNVQLRAGR